MCYHNAILFTARTSVALCTLCSISIWLPNIYIDITCMGKSTFRLSPTIYTMAKTCRQLLYAAVVDTHVLSIQMQSYASQSTSQPSLFNICTWISFFVISLQLLVWTLSSFMQLIHVWTSIPIISSYTINWLSNIIEHFFL